MRPEDLFKQEKERATSAAKSQHARLLAEAKAAFDKLMAEGQAARKSGRPRKHPLPPLKTGSALRPPNVLPQRFTPAPMPVVREPAAPAKAKPVAARKDKQARPKARPKAKAKAKKKR